MKQIYLNDWIEFKLNDVQFGGSVIKLLGNTITVKLQGSNAIITIPDSAIIRINYKEIRDEICLHE